MQGGLDVGVVGMGAGGLSAGGKKARIERGKLSIRASGS